MPRTTAPATVTAPTGAKNVTFKHEGRYGPVWFVTDSGAYLPAIPGDPDFTGTPTAVWLSKTEAGNIAKHFNLPLVII